MASRYRDVIYSDLTFMATTNLELSLGSHHIRYTHQVNHSGCILVQGLTLEQDIVRSSVNFLSSFKVRGLTWYYGINQFE